MESSIRGAGRESADGERNPAFETLAWDSEHFGLAIARVRGPRLDLELAQAAQRWCLDRGVDCLYLLADADDAETARVAARHGFRVVDVRLNLRHDLSGLGSEPWHSPGTLSVRRAEDRDLPGLARIAAASHRTTRFYFDGNFPAERCDALYVRWVERAFADPEHELLVAELEGEAVGYHALRLPGPEPARADLIAIDPRHRGRGLGAELLRSSLRLLRDLGAERVATAMQARNTGAVRGHERDGFLLESTQVWHHRWYQERNGR